MKVRMLVQITGTHDGTDWPAPGTVVELPDGEAVSLLNAKLAAPVADAPEAAVVAEDAETAVAKRPARRRKG